ncbi:hypothetical protein EDC96DRAFT_545349 [Choanephora cucurbitarum]|nr:hypothetical protein EDC96DRAFT_545349 [Choanephora cucurbitarum]
MFGFYCGSLHFDLISFLLFTNVTRHIKNSSQVAQHSKTRSKGPEQKTKAFVTTTIKAGIYSNSHWLFHLTDSIFLLDTRSDNNYNAALYTKSVDNINSRFLDLSMSKCEPIRVKAYLAQDCLIFLVESKLVWLSPRIIKSGLPMVANTSKAFKQLKQKCLSQKKFLWPWQVGNSLTKHQNQSPLASHAPSPQEAKKKGRLRPQGGGILVTLVVPILAGLNQSAIASTKGDVSGGAYERGSLSYQVGCLWLISKVLTFLSDTLWLSTYCYFSLVWPVYSFGTTIYCFSVVLVYQD